jgi:hypothetical protein
MLKKTFSLAVLNITVLSLWFSFTSFSVYFPIRLKKEHHLVATFKPYDMETYKGLIPKEFEMPEEPKVKLDFVQVNPHWHECYVSIRVNYKGKPTWHAIVWAIDKWVPYKLGRWVGYPKFMADSMNYNLGENEAKQWVIRDGKLFLSMDYTKSIEEKHSYCASEWENMEIYHLLTPPLKGPKMNILTFEFCKKPQAYVEQHGTINLKFDSSQSWAKLISNNGTATVDGIYFKRDKKAILWLHSKRVKQK